MSNQETNFTPKILIVDDTESARETLGDLLSIGNYELLFAEDGYQALQMADQHTPDLLLLDVMMPEMDGFEVCRKIRKNPNLTDLPIILITALDDKDSMIEGIEAGADDFISKPFDRHLLRLRIKTITKLNRFGKISQERKEKEETQQILEQQKELNLLKSRFISMVSHEFRTPLAAINFAASFMQKYGNRLDEDKRSHKLKKIVSQVNHMVDMLNDVLTIGHNEAGRMQFDPKPQSFNTFIQTIINDTCEAFRNSHIIHFQPITPDCTVMLDRKIARELFTNLLSNAIKFSPQVNKVEMQASTDHDKLNIQIRDFGIGIPQKDLENLFTPFHRGSNVEGIQGTGLGLKIVKDAIEAHKGVIRVESKQNEGTIFHIQLSCITSEYT